MSQLTIYLDSETQRKLTLAAKRESISLSSWARKHLAKAADVSESTAWDHISLFAGAAQNDFEPPTRETTHRSISEL
ncbi:MAG: hypothetical protein ACK46A_14310 [Akkermansiaceae bacterium]|jgi:hypothetical protein|nr:hypothetical protein [Luteolibacter sp.]